MYIESPDFLANPKGMYFVLLHKGLALLSHGAMKQKSIPFLLQQAGAAIHNFFLAKNGGRLHNTT